MKVLKFNWLLLCISVILLAGGLQFFFLPSWCKPGVDVSFDLDIAKKTYVRVFYVEKGAFTEAQVVSLPVHAGSNQVRCAVPVAKLTRLRVDFGSKPGKFTISPIELSGETTITHRWTDSERRNGISTWAVGADGRATGVSDHRNPFVMADLSKNPVPGRMRVHWPSVALSLILCAVFFVKPLRSIGPYVSPVGSDGRVFVYDILRVIAFFSIVISHVVAHDATPGWIQTSGCGVSWFIILSGASLGLQHKEASWWGFVRKRFASILPPFWVAYVLMVVLIFLVRKQVFIGNDPFKWAITVCGVDGFLAKRYPGNYYLIGEWFVGFILGLYVLAPYVLRGCRKMPIIAFLLCCLASVIWWRYNLFLSCHFPFCHSGAFWNPVVRLPEFAFGAVLSLYVIQSRRMLIGGGLVAAAVLAVTALGLKHFFGFGSYTFLPGYAALFVVICAVSAFVRFGDAFRGIINFLARHAFFAFLVHHQIILWVLAVSPRKGFVSRDAYVVIVVLTTIVLSFVLAWLCARPVAAVRALVFERGAKS